MKFLKETKDSKILINKYKLSDFGHSDKAVWIEDKITHSIPRYEDKYGKYFLPSYYIAGMNGYFYIPAYIMDKFIEENSKSYNNINKRTLEPLAQKWLPRSQWDVMVASKGLSK